MAEIVCIGQAVVDCITRGRETQAHKKNVYRAKSISLNIGGDALNEAVILSHLGHKVRLVCGVGEDAAGHLLINEAKSHGIDISGIEINPQIATPIANLMVNEDGSRSSINSRATMLTGYEPKEEEVQGAKIVSLASLFRAPLDRSEKIISLVQAAKKEGAIICADTKMPTYRQLGMSDIEEILPLIDYMFPNENEGAYYTGESSYMAMARHLRNLGVKNVVVKTGEKGCVVCGEQESFIQEAYSVPSIDSTGAGDNFVAGFISGLLKGWNLRECCEYGTACAAVCVQSIGATTGVKNAQIVVDFLKSNRKTG